MKKELLLGSLLLVVFGAGCAPNPALNTSTSSSAVRTAEAIGANTTPLAAYHLQLARQGISDAEKLAANGKRERAESMLLRAKPTPIWPLGSLGNRPRNRRLRRR